MDFRSILCLAGLPYNKITSVYGIRGRDSMKDRIYIKEKSRAIIGNLFMRLRSHGKLK